MKKETGKGGSDVTDLDRHEGEEHDGEEEGCRHDAVDRALRPTLLQTRNKTGNIRRTCGYSDVTQGETYAQVRTQRQPRLDVAHFVESEVRHAVLLGAAR